MTGVIVLKFQAGTSSDLVLSRTRIKNSLLLCHLVSCCTEILSGCMPLGETKGFLMCVCMTTSDSLLTRRCQSHRSEEGKAII